jgi:hypothetical protein
VPSSEVTKCDTNTPRRLVTHLLQQVVQSFTSRRHSGHGSANATRNNTNAKDKTTIAKASKASSEYHTMEALYGGSEYKGKVGCRAATYSTSSGTKSGSSSEKQLVGKGEYKRTQHVQPHQRRGLRVDHAQDISRIRLRFIYKHIYSCRGSFPKRFSQTIL